MATPQYIVRAVGSGGQLDINVLSPDDNVGYAFGTDSDAVFYLSSALIEAYLTPGTQRSSCSQMAVRRFCISVTVWPLLAFPTATSPTSATLH